MKSDGTTSYYHSDHLGSSNVISDANGNKVAQYEYQPYGKLSFEEPLSNHETRATNHLFTGKELDSTGLYYYGARYYDPEIGRFISPDTIVQSPYDPQTLNRYTYVRNNPLKYTDPSGHFFWAAVIIGAIIGGAAGGIAAHRNGEEVWKGALIGAVMGACPGATLGSSSAPLILKFAATFSLGSQVAGAIPGSTAATISRYSGYAAMGLAAIHIAWNIGVGIKDWAIAKGTFHDVKTGTKLSMEEVVQKYGEEGAKVFVNGITQDLQSALDMAKDKGMDILFYNPTSGTIADLTESALGTLSHTSSLSRQLGRLATQMSVDLIGYSQGSIISANALVYAGFHGGTSAGSTIRTYASAVGRIRLSYSAAIGGAKVKQGAMHTFDVIKLISAELNPINYLEGIMGAFLLGREHVNY